MTSVLERESSPITDKQSLVFQYNLDSVQPGISRKSIEFLSKASLSEAYKQLSERRRRLIEAYFTTDISTVSLGSVEHISRTSVNREIRLGLQSLWNSLPEDLKQNYPQEEVVKMKDLLSPEFRKKRSEQGKKLMQDPAYKERLNNANRSAWQNEQHRQRMTNIRKQMWNNSEKVEKQRQKMVVKWQDPVYRETMTAKLSKATTKLWQDPVYRKSVVSTLNGRTHSSSSREKISRAKKADWQDPKRREIMMAGVRKTHERLSYRAKSRESTTALWASKEYRNMRIRTRLEKNTTIVINGNWLEGENKRRVILELSEMWALAALGKAVGQQIRLSTLSLAIVNAGGPAIDKFTMGVLINKIKSVTQARIKTSYAKSLKHNSVEPLYTLNAKEVILESTH